MGINGVEVSESSTIVGTVHFLANTFNQLSFNRWLVRVQSFLGKTSQVQVFKTALSDC